MCTASHASCLAPGPQASSGKQKPEQINLLRRGKIHFQARRCDRSLKLGWEQWEKCSSLTMTIRLPTKACLAFQIPRASGWRCCWWEDGIYYFILLCVLFGIFPYVLGKPYTAVTSTTGKYSCWLSNKCVSFFPYQDILSTGRSYQQSSSMEKLLIFLCEHISSHNRFHVE